MRQRTRRDLLTALWIIVIVVAVAALYGGVLRGGNPFIGGAVGLPLGICFAGLEMLYLQRRHYWSVRRLALARTVYSTALSMAWLSFGYYVFGEIGSLELYRLSHVTAYWSGGQIWRDLTFVAAIGMLLTATLAMRRLIGPGVLMPFLLGRYHRPRREQRVFLFLDLVGSTALTERIGDLEFHTFLATLFNQIAEPISEHRGQIERYIGDLVVVSWPLAVGIEKARCLACVAAIAETIAASAARYRERFGTVPRFRAGLHAGPVVAGEVGDDKVEVMYLGDTVNTAARLEQMCRSFEAKMLISDELKRRLGPLPAGWRLRDRGCHVLRGHDHPTRLWSLDWPAAPGAGDAAS